jgi:hypothetical protein
MMTRAILVAACAVAALSTSARAAPPLINGDFETGDYTGWSVNVEDGSDGALSVIQYSVGATPISNAPFQNNAAGGQFFSTSDQGGPGSYSLTQSFTLETFYTVTIRWDQFANNWAGVDFANGRDFTTDPNQNAVVDILTGTADPFTDAPGDIVATLWGPGSDNFAGNPNPWTSYAVTLNLAAGTYQLRFAETDNQSFFNFGVDNVAITVAVPEPASWAMMITGFGLVGGALRSRRRLSVQAG